MSTQDIVIRTAERKRVKLRMGISGPSGSGKTTAALLLAYGMTGNWSKICVIDTENESAALYVGHRFGDTVVDPFPHIALNEPYNPERYIAALHAAENAGVEVIIFDSATHEWDGKGGCLELVDQLGGKYQDWAKVTPRHRRFIDAFLQSSAHIITTMRTKQDYAMESGESKDGKGKVKVTKLGMKEVQREGFEYELTLNFSLEINHLAKASKDRTGLFMNQPEFMITPATGRQILDWNQSGKEPPKDYTIARRRVLTEAARLGLDPRSPNFRAILTSLTSIDATKDENLEDVARKMETIQQAPKEQPAMATDNAKEPEHGEAAEEHPEQDEIDHGQHRATPDQAGLEDIDFESQAEIEAKASAGKTAAVPEGGAVDTAPRPQPGMSPAAAMMRYQARIEAAKDLTELDGIYGEWILDKVVLASPVATAALTKLNEQKMDALMGNAPTAPKTAQEASKPENEVKVVHDENSQARGGQAAKTTPAKAASKKRQAVKPSVAPRQGVCASCDGKGTTASGDCASCDGTGIPKH